MVRDKLSSSTVGETTIIMLPKLQGYELMVDLSKHEINATLT